MVIITNKYIPFKGFSAMNVCGILFVREGERISDTMLNHESIHTAQMKETSYVVFYIWYVIEWLIRLVKYRNFDKAYRNISFEREAYENERYSDYLDSRKKFAWLKYLK